MQTSIESELHIFEKNTDAISVNRGFYYQVIKTMEKWLDNYTSKNKSKIYCETEDDIKSISSTGELTYSQIKCYSSDFTLNSLEIKKTLFNSFSLHVKYKTLCKTFKYETNSSSSDEILTKWSKDKGLIDSTLFAECRKLTHEIIQNEYKAQKDSKIAVAGKKIETLKKKKPKTSKNQDKIKLEIHVLENEKTLISDTYVRSEHILNDELDYFIKKIVWEFGSVEPETAVSEVVINCYARIQGIKEFKMVPKLIYGRLISEIYKRSKEQAIEDRLLDDTNLEIIIQESEEELKNNSDQEILNHITTGIDKLSTKIEGVQEVLLNAINDKVPVIEKTLLLEFKSEDEIEKIKIDELLNDAISEHQSNLERKIKEINLETASEDTIIKYATELRCSYLIYLEELRLKKLTVEYEILKKLEKEVRHECIMSVCTILEKEDFNSKEFWTEFKKNLTDLISRHSQFSGIKLDPSFVFAQMYQIAAECHLKWRKEVHNV